MVVFCFIILGKQVPFGTELEPIFDCARFEALLMDGFKKTSDCLGLFRKVSNPTQCTIGLNQVPVGTCFPGMIKPEIIITLNSPHSSNGRTSVLSDIILVLKVSGSNPDVGVFFLIFFTEFLFFLHKKS